MVINNERRRRGGGIVCLKLYSSGLFVVGNNTVKIQLQHWLDRKPQDTNIDIFWKDVATCVINILMRVY